MLVKPFPKGFGNPENDTDRACQDTKYCQQRGNVEIRYQSHQENGKNAGTKAATTIPTATRMAAVVPVKI
jgi:hypothetical protein